MTSGTKKVILSKNSEEVARARYFQEDEDWEGLSKRVARAISLAELPEKQKEYADKFGEIIYNMDFLPAGRILRNSGRPRGTLLNCFVLPCNDSIEEIGQFMKDSLILWAEGGGVGCNFSYLRPKGDVILGKGGKSSGLVSFLEAADHLSKTIESGGSRRAAGMALVDISHPEVMDFINCKLVDKKIAYFNISVAINEDFLTAVELNKDWEFKFKQRSYGKIKARELWDLIVKNMLNCAEPGLINWDNLTKNNSYYFDPVISTNPCMTGDTKIVLDNQNVISFKELVDSNIKEIQIYSWDTNKKFPCFKMMRNIRKTRENVKILKITFNNNKSIRCTEDHKLYINNDEKKEAKDLKIGDKLLGYERHYIKDSFRVFDEKYYNPEIISISQDGCEDVYNGTVDDTHNYFISLHNSKDDQFTILSANCGEATLSPYGACDLGSLNLPNFITGNVNTNWKKLAETIKLSVRFLDNVLDCNKYPIKEIDIKCHESRRIGLGIMGLADYLFAKQIKYGSQESLNEIERLMRFIRDTAYSASIELSVEKGSFPKFDPVLYTKAAYIRSLPPSIRMEIKEKGVRNVTLFSVAPAGSISLVANTSSGLEPLPFKAYIRKDRVSERLYVHPKFQEYIERGEKCPDWLVDSHDIAPKDHFEVQRAVQSLIDGSVSKTINLPKGTKEKDLSKLLLVYMRDLKGCTVYCDGSREGQVLNKIDDKEVLKYIKENKTTNDLSEEDVKCAKGTCEWTPPKES